MSERTFRRWAVAAVIVVALVPWLTLPWHLALILGPVTAILGAGYLVSYIVRTNHVYRRQ